MSVNRLWIVVLIRNWIVVLIRNWIVGVICIWLVHVDHVVRHSLCGDLQCLCNILSTCMLAAFYLLPPRNTECRGNTYSAPWI